jgi:hypothetical protein
MSCLNFASPEESGDWSSESIGCRRLAEGQAGVIASGLKFLSSFLVSFFGSCFLVLGIF